MGNLSISLENQTELMTRTALHHRAVRVVTPSGLEPVNIKWIPLTPGRAVQYNGTFEIERMWQQDNK